MVELSLKDLTLIYLTVILTLIILIIKFCPRLGLSKFLN